jgi:hypothetical protein
MYCEVLYEHIRSGCLTNYLPEKHLRRGQVGTVVEILAPGVVEVEFADLDGNTYAMCSVPESNLLVLHHIPAAIAA